MSRHRVVASLRAWPLLVLCVAALLKAFDASAGGESWARLYPGLDNVAGIVTLHEGRVGLVAGGNYFRLSAGGDVEVQVDMPGPKGLTRSTGVIALPGERLLIVGFTNPRGVKRSLGWVRAITADGVVEWERSYRSLHDRDVSIDAAALLGDGSVVVGGSVGQASLIMRLDSRGTVVWQRTYDFPDEDRVRALVALPDRGLVATSWSRESTYVMRLDDRGEVQWCSSFRGAVVAGLALDAGGNIVAVGTRGFGGAGVDDALIVSIHPDGSVQWAEQVGGPEADYGSTVMPFLDGTLWISGRTLSEGNGKGDGWLLNIDSAGQLLSQITIGTERDEGTANGGPMSALALQKDRILIASVSRPEAGPALLIAALQPNRGICTLSKRSTASVYKSDIAFQSGKPEVSAAGLTVGTLGPTEAGARIIPKEICSTSVSLGPESAQSAKPSPHAAAIEADTEGYFAPSKMLLNRKFADLDALEAKYLRDKSVNETGTRNLTLFYGGLNVTDGELQKLPRETVLALCREWVAHSPRSPAATIALAAALLDYGAMERGGGFTDAVSKTGWKNFEELAAESNTVLARGAEWASVDPQYFSVLMWLRGASGVEGSVEEAFREGVKVDRTYLPLYRSRANLLLPKWSGDETALARFADAAGAISGERGDMMYAIVALRADWSGPFGEDRAGDLAGPLGLSWPRLRKGLTELATRYPKSNYYSGTLACIALERTDKSAFREAIDKLHMVWTPGVGCMATQKAFEEAMNWLRAPAAVLAPVAVAGPAGPVVKPGAGLKATPPSVAAQALPGDVPFVEQPISKWPPIVLRNRLELQGGTVVTDFASFILRLNERDVLVTTSQVVPHRELDLTDFRNRLGPPPPTPAMILQGKLARWSVSMPGDSRELFLVTGFAFPGSKTSRDGPMAVVMSIDAVKKSKSVRALSPRMTPLAGGNRVFAVACLPAGPDCRQTVISGLVSGRSIGTGETFGEFHFQPDEPPPPLNTLLGAPVLDDTGALAGLIVRSPFEGERPAIPICEEIGLVLKKATTSSGVR